MSNTVRVQTPNFRITGDGTSTSITLAFGEYPFPPNLPGRVTAVDLALDPFSNPSISFTSKTCTINFDAFTSDKLTGLLINCDPS